jgi:hypothetical protein
MPMTWDAIVEQWPWFSAAAGVLVVVVGLVIVLKPKSKRHLKTTSSAADNEGWILTGRIDFVDHHSVGDLMLQVEETRIANSPGGVEHREIRWRRATLNEAKIVLVSYHAQRKLLMTANFVVNAPTETSRNGQSEKGGLKDVANGQGLADVKPVAAEATSEAP